MALLNNLALDEENKVRNDAYDDDVICVDDAMDDDDGDDDDDDFVVGGYDDDDVCVVRYDIQAIFLMTNPSIRLLCRAALHRFVYLAPFM